MKKPQTPPAISGILHKGFDHKKIDAVMHRAVEPPGDYPHWDKLRHLKPPDGLSAEEWWLGIKLKRGGLLKDIPLLDKEGKPCLTLHACLIRLSAMKTPVQTDPNGRVPVSSDSDFLSI